MFVLIFNCTVSMLPMCLNMEIRRCVIVYVSLRDYCIRKYGFCT